MRAAEAKLKAFGGTVQAFGQSLIKLGALATLPLLGGVKAFSNYEDALAALRSAANPTAEELKRIETAITDISKATGTGPAQVAAAMTELLKAGLSVETVLGGAADATLKFARVAELEAAEAAVVLADAMTVFGVDAKTAVDTLSRAADASSVSLRQVTESFSQASAVAKLAGLSIEETANAIAILGQAGVKGSDAGTSLKTMLLRLQAPVEEGAEEFRALGLNVRDADGSMKDMRGIIKELQAKLAGLSGEARDSSLRKLFGSDAIRAGAILIGQGAEGWDAFTAKMREGLPVAAKFEILMDTLSGSVRKGLAALERLGIEIGQALVPIFRDWGEQLVRIGNGLADVVRDNQALIVGIAKAIGIVAAVGAGMVAAGIAVKVLAAGFGILGVAIGLVTSPLGLLTAALVGGGYVLLNYTEDGNAALATLGTAFGDLKTDATTAFAAIADALKSGDVALAGKIAFAGLKLEQAKALLILNAGWADWGVATTNVWRAVQTEIAKGLIDTEGGWGSMIARLTKKFIPFSDLIIQKFGLDIPNAIDIALKTSAGGPKRGGANKQAAADRRTTLATLDTGLAAETDKRQVDAQAGVAAAAAELAAAQAEFDRLRTQAPRGEAEIGAGAKAKPTPGKEEEKKVVAGIKEAASRAEAKGTFSASAIRSLGIGDTVADDSLKEHKKTNQKLDQVKKAVERGGPKFT